MEEGKEAQCVQQSYTETFETRGSRIRKSETQLQKYFRLVSLCPDLRSTLLQMMEEVGRDHDRNCWQDRTVQGIVLLTLHGPSVVGHEQRMRETDAGVSGDTCLAIGPNYSEIEAVLLNSKVRART